MLGNEGAHVFLIGRTREPMEVSKADIEQAGGHATVTTFDIQNITQLQDFIADVQTQTGRLDILVNNAGVQFPDSIIDANPEDWRTMLETNILAVLAGSQAAVHAMRASGSEGHIVNISSTAAQSNERGVYGATKHAVNVISATLRTELENDTIRVTTVMPGAVATNFARNYDPAFLKSLIGSGELPFEPQRGQQLPPPVLEQIQTRLKQVLCSPKDIAHAVLYAVTQPIHVNVAEIVVRPPKTLNI